MPAVLLLADCDPPTTGERVQTLLYLALALAVVLAIAAAILRERNERSPLALTYLGAAIAGGLVYAVPGGLADVGTLFAIAVAAGAAGGLAVSARRHRRPLSYLAAGLMGGATFWGGALALLIGFLAVSGGCLD
jgi:hypothetical protein